MSTTDRMMWIEHGLLPGHVLQRVRGVGGADIRGGCRASGPVCVSVRRGARIVPGFDGRRIGRAAHGRFEARLRRLPVGGPYRITLHCGDAMVDVRDVFVGDLWLMAGQSNMEGCAVLADAPAPHPLVRCFTLARRWELARDPLHLHAESPDAVRGGQSLSPAAAAQARRTAERGGGVGVHFGRRMLARTGVPQGLIATAHGGTSMAQWDPALRSRGGASFYGSMLLSLRAVAQPVAGVLWYQGESEALPRLADIYTQRMRRLVAAVRRGLGQPNAPWLMVQLGRFVVGGYQNPEGWPDAAAWYRVQELQRLLPQTIDRCAVVPAVDLELEDLVHLASDAYPVLADRLAEIANLVVHRDRRAEPPIDVQSVRFSAHPKPRITVAFDHVAGALRSAGPAAGFVLLDPAGQPFPAIYRVRLQGHTAVLELTTAAIADLRLGYGHGLDPRCNVVDNRGMAVPVFGPLAIAQC